jgi:subtilisin
MTHMRRVRTMARMLVAITLTVTMLYGSAFATSGDNIRLIVTFKNINLKNSLDYIAVSSLLTTLGSDVVQDLLFINALAIELPVDLLSEVLKLLNSLDEIEVVDDLISLVDPTCPTSTLQLIPETYPWGLQQINVPPAHEQWPESQGSGVKVAILDTGIDQTHLSVGEFSNRGAGGYNALAGKGSYADDNGHGTHMAGIIASALNSVGITGAAPKAKLVGVKVLDKSGAGYLSDVVNGLEWVYNNNIRLVNISLGFAADSKPLRQAIKLLHERGVIMVASAGNRCAADPGQEDGGGADCRGGPAAACDDPLTSVLYPAAYDEVIAVAASDMYDRITDYSLPGSQVEVTAPGGTSGSGRILSTDTVGGYGLGYGTSQAAAHVTAAIALVLQQKPGISLKDVRDLLRSTAEDLGDPKERQGAGRIDVENMLRKLLP